MSTMTVSEEKNEKDPIKTMKLYSHVERIDNELKALGFDEESELDIDKVSQLDSMHYNINNKDGEDTVQTAIDIIVKENSDKTNNSDDMDKDRKGIEKNINILDVGSGFGGPTRYIATHFNNSSSDSSCSHLKLNNVIALELQQDVHEKGLELTTRCKLQEHIVHKHGDILKCFGPRENEILSLIENCDSKPKFDAIVSWLAFLHIPQKKTLFKICSSLLKNSSADDGNDNKDNSKGVLYIEDYYELKPFTKEEKYLLKEEVYCSNLPTKDEYVMLLHSCFFPASSKNKTRGTSSTDDYTKNTSIQFIDKTDEWKTYVSERLTKFEENKDNFIQIHNQSTYDSLHKFYDAVNKLFSSGNLGGARIIVTI